MMRASITRGTQMDLPMLTADATPEFMTDALRAGGVIDGATRVSEVGHEPVGEGVGIVGQLARLQLRYEGTALGAPGTVIIKLPSQFPENRAVGDHFNFYEREGRFYQQLSDKISTRTPRCYWNHLDPATNSFGLLLEDLGSRTMISQVAGVDHVRAAQALHALAQLHGTWWSSPALDSIDWMPHLDDPITLAAGPMYREVWPLCLERIGDELPPGAVELGEMTQRLFEELVMTSVSDAPITILHGDFRVDNLMFDDGAEDEDRVAVLDWQISFRGPAIFDVAYFLCQSLDIEERRAHERTLVRDWYDAVTIAHGGPLVDYPFDLAWTQYRRATLLTTVYPVAAVGSMDLANERGRELCVAMATRSFTSALDLDAREFMTA
jgi:thiamine kinase-like enzyme